MGQWRIAIVEDHPLTRLGLRRQVEAWPHGQVVLEAKDGVEYEELCAVHGAPDLALVDLCMPRRDGWETLAWIAEQQPGTKALAFTFDPEDDAVMRALHQKACGVLSKSDEPEEWLTALDHVRLTSRYHNQYSERALLHVPDPGSPAGLRRKARKSLSPSMLNFALAYTADDEPSIAAAADRIGVKENTAETYRKRLRERTGASTRLAIYKFLLRFHLAKP
jgi:two-component system invasion response regulator UvrY